MLKKSSAISSLLGVLALATILVSSTAGYLILQPLGNEPIGDGGAPIRVQGNARGTSVTNSISVTMAATPTSGNALVAVIGTYNSPARTVSSISETNVTWTLQKSKAATYNDVEIWFGVVGAGASKTITVTLSGTSSGVADVCEYSGLATSGFLDQTASATNTNTNPLTGTTATTTQAAELWIGGVDTLNGIGGVMSSPTNGFTLLDGANQANHLCGYLEKIVSAKGTANSGVSTSQNYEWVGCIATFKANRAPNAPSLSNPAADYRFNPSTPVTFSWAFSDPDAGDYQTAYQFQLASDSGFSSLLINPGKTTDWRLGWSYYKSHVINVDSAAGTGYQVQIIAYFGLGADSGNTVYLNNHARMDFGDVRFTASDGTTLLSYWMQSCNSGVSATFWVKITGDLSTSQTIYVYYGNSGAATTSSIANTFLFGDDFRLDTTVDASKWVASGSPTTAFDSTNGLTMTRPTGIATLRSVNTYSFFTSKKVITEFKITNAGSWDAGFYVCPTSTTGDPYSQANFVSLCLSDNQAIRYLVKKISGTVNTLRTLSGSTTVFHKNSLMVKTTTTGYIGWVEDGTQQYSNAAETMYNADLNYIYPYVAASGSVSLSLIMKYIALAKYVDPEPSQSAGGSEETPQQTTQTLPATVGLYYWRVTSWDSFGTQGPYSTGRTIFVDRVKITACGIFNNVIDTRIGGSVYYQAVYEADSTAFTGSNGTLSLSSGPMTWSTDRWICTFSYPTSGNQAVFHISGFTETPYGLTTMNNAAGDLGLNWSTMAITINKP